MKKLIIYLLIIFITANCAAQTGTFSSVNARSSLTVNAKKVTSISNDSTLHGSGASSLSLVTEYAVYNYLQHHLSGGGGFGTLQQTTSLGATTNVFSSFSNGAYFGIPGITVNNGSFSSIVTSKVTATQRDTLPDASGTVALETWVTSSAGGKFQQGLFGMTGTVVIPANTTVKQVAIVINNYVQRVTIGSTLHGSEYFDDVVTVGTPYMVLINTYFSSSTTLYFERYDSGHPAALWTIIVYYN